MYHMFNRCNQYVCTLPLHGLFDPAFYLPNKASDLGIVPPCQGLLGLTYGLLDLLGPDPDLLYVVDLGLDLVDELRDLHVLLELNGGFLGLLHGLANNPVVLVLKGHKCLVIVGFRDGNIGSCFLGTDDHRSAVLDHKISPVVPLGLLGIPLGGPNKFAHMAVLPLGQGLLCLFDVLHG